MLTFLLRILAFLWILWILRKIFGFPPGKRSKPPSPHPQGDGPKNTVKDPVCGMYMDPGLAIRVQRKEGDLFFCSEECRRRYLAGKDFPC